MPHPSTQIANAIIALGQRRHLSFTPLQIIKLTYIAHGWSLVLLDTSLVDEPAAAWLYGPVFPNLYHDVKRYRAAPITEPLSSFTGGLNGLSRNETELLEQIVSVYGKFSGGQLSNMTHRPGTPWHQIWNKYGQNATIPNSIIRQHYEALHKRQ